MYDNDVPSQPADNGRAHKSHEEDGSPRPVTGILDVVDNRAFVRTEGYLPGPRDAPVPLELVREHGLRRGDTVTGKARPAGRDERPAPLVQVDTINGQHPRHAMSRAVFSELVPLYSNQRMRLETEPHALTTRVTDLLMPVGKGQRALIVAPPKAGKTSVLQAIAHGIAKNHPECHLMLVLVGERPEEVTDLARAVPGEVIAATFDHPPHEHTALAELAIDRAKRLVEVGRDVVVMLDSTALVPPKRFLGAARNIENGGSLTIFATALVDTGSVGDTLIFEEYKGTSNAELRLDRKIASKRVYPAIDIVQSSTRKEELLLTTKEMAATRALRRALDGRDSQQAIDMLLDGLRKTHTNTEFLTQLTRTTPHNGSASGTAGR
jgi:transcription termination factor Rho